MSYESVFGRSRGPNRATTRARSYALYAEHQGKPRWGDKTPIYIESMRTIARGLPEAHFIHLIRDGRDVAVSLLRLEWGGDAGRRAKMWKERIERGREQARKLEWYLEIRYEDLVGDPEPTLRRVLDFIDLPWHDAVLGHHRGAYERLRELARDLERPGMPTRSAEERMRAHAIAHKPPDVSAVGRWKRSMRSQDRADFESVAGDLLVELGYQAGDQAR